MKRKPATIVAGIYSLSVVGSYIDGYIEAIIVHDRSGLSFIPFLYLSWPWSLLFSGVAAKNLVEGIAITVLCFLLLGLNALALYFLTAACLAAVSRIVRRRRT
jgi:hypothetical protein